MTDDARHEAWEARYGVAAVWTGRVNAHLEDWVEAHPSAAPGASIDLACGEGADAIWLAAQGWRATGVDFSQAAIDRAFAAARDRGVEATWIVADLTAWKADQPADLVTVSFLHEPAQVRHAVWRTAASAVAEGGTLLITGHRPDVEGVSGPPPETRFTAEEVIAALGATWQADVREVHRDGVGHHAGHVMTDLIITLTRAAPESLAADLH
jgi:SAM-dependent methyltransferase